jgi:hypothetical protein
MSITGDISLTSETITMAHKSFKLKFVREVGKQALQDVGKIVDYPQPASRASLYKTMISSHVVLANANTICGRDDGTWMLAAYDNNKLSLAFFSGTSEPDLDYKVVEVSHTLCGTYAYVTAGR